LKIFMLALPERSIFQSTVGTKPIVLLSPSLHKNLRFPWRAEDLLVERLISLDWFNQSSRGVPLAMIACK